MRSDTEADVPTAYTTDTMLNDTCFCSRSVEGEGVELACPGGRTI